MKICIFCSANEDIAPEYFRLTEELGRWAAAAGHTIVFGGTNEGLMRCLGQAAHDAGAQTIGVVPTKIVELNRLSNHLDVHIPCNSLSERKDLMNDQGDISIALPGGLGTLDEVFSVVASATLDYHSKRVVLYNMCGFWDSLIAMLDDLQAKRVIRRDWRDYILVAENIEDVARICSDCNSTDR